MKKRIVTGILTLCLLLTGCADRPADPGPDLGNQSPSQTRQTGETVPAVPMEQAEGSAGNPAEPETPDSPPPDAYAGVWRDSAADTGGCRISIDGSMDAGYTIEIRWEQEEGVCHRWTLTGSYDETWQGIDYLGSHCADRTAGDGTVETETILAEETGLLYLDEEGILLWEDTYEHLGDDLRFLREPQ